MGYYVEHTRNKRLEKAIQVVIVLIISMIVGFLGSYIAHAFTLDLSDPEDWSTFNRGTFVLAAFILAFFCAVLGYHICKED